MAVDQGVQWESDGKGEYTVKHVTKKQRGTEIILFITDEQKEYLDGHRLRAIIRKYSDHILLPICMSTRDGRRKKKKMPVKLLFLKKKWLTKPMHFGHCLK